jgi:PAS domain-containing protein
MHLLSNYSLSLIEASRDPLVTISIEGKITDMNEATVKITGVERDFTGSDFFTLLSLKWREKYIRRYSQKDLLLIHHLLFVTKKEN